MMPAHWKIYKDITQFYMKSPAKSLKLKIRYRRIEKEEKRDLTEQALSF